MTTPSAPLIITFDDGYVSHYNDAFPYMQALGLKATDYMATYHIGVAGYCSAANLQAMSAGGWIIGNHTRNHIQLATLTEAQQETELQNGYDDLAAIGITTGKHIAYPGGSYNADTMTAMAAVGALTGRASVAGAFFPPIANNYLINNTYVGNTHPLAQVKATIDTAQNLGQILLISFHDLVASSPGTYDWLLSDFQALMDYIVEHGYPTITVADLYDLM